MIGSSQIGCSFEENPRYKNKLVWRPSIPVQFTLMWVLELCRQGRLGSVKTIVTDLNYATMGVQKGENLARYWYEMLPVSWRYPELLPLSAWVLPLSPLKYPTRSFEVVSSGHVDPGIALPARSDEWKAKRWRECQENHVLPPPECSMCFGWRQSVLASFMRLNEICRQRGIQFVVVRPPLSQYYRDHMDMNTQSELEGLVAELKASGITVDDCSEVLPDDFFMDLIHLSSGGAKKFTAHFCGIHSR